MWFQKEMFLKARSRGFHIITHEIVNALPELRTLQVGLLHVFIQHTSASLTLNENADPSVRADFENYFRHLVPENETYYAHNDEGEDDLPAHIKASLLGHQVTVPIKNGQLQLGTWQGIYLGEHRNFGGSRRVILTVMGE